MYRNQVSGGNTINPVPFAWFRYALGATQPALTHSATYLSRNPKVDSYVVGRTFSSTSRSCEARSNQASIDFSE
ncbi:hypothetical protein H8E77_38885 [bacterium]|nr:hypothetical protein [bacterium]